MTIGSPIRRSADPRTATSPRRRRPRLRDTQLRTRLSLILAVPVVAVLVLGGMRLADVARSAYDVSVVGDLTALSADLSELSHRVHRERMAAAEYLAAADAPAAPYTAQIAQVNQQITVYQQRRDQLTDVPGAVAARLTRIDEDLAGLAATRTAVQQRAQLTVGDAVSRYRAVIHDLVSYGVVLGQVAEGGEIADEVRAVATFAEAKAGTAEAQAAAFAALASGKLADEPYAEFLATEAAHQAAMDAFQLGATDEQRSLVQDTVAGAAVGAADRARAQLRQSAGRNARISAVEAAAAIGAVGDLMRDAERKLETQVQQDAQTVSGQAVRRAVVEGGVVLVVLLLTLLLAIMLSRSLLGSLRKLREGALAVAHRDLPDAVARLRDVRNIGDSAAEDIIRKARESIQVGNRDEVGQVAQAFNVVHQEAVRIAAEQAALRTSVSAMFLNLARRSQSLVDRMIGELDQIERGEEDPKRLAQLFELDHLATRMRRNDENLLVLAGADSTSPRREDALLIDALRAAQSEVELYNRIEFGSIDTDIMITALAVNDTVRLLAELLDNATRFSPPNTVVVADARRVRDYVVVQIEDRGLGMSEEQMTALNTRLAQPPDVDVAAFRLMGLAVVGRLASRFGIRVELRANAEGGTVATITLPSSIVVLPAPVPVAAGARSAVALAEAPTATTRTATATLPDVAPVSWDSGTEASGPFPGPAPVPGVTDAPSRAYEPTAFAPASYEPATYEPPVFEPAVFEPAAFEPTRLDSPAASGPDRARTAAPGSVPAGSEHTALAGPPVLPSDGGTGTPTVQLPALPERDTGKGAGLPPLPQRSSSGRRQTGIDWSQPAYPSSGAGGTSAGADQLIPDGTASRAQDGTRPDPDRVPVDRAATESAQSGFSDAGLSVMGRTASGVSGSGFTAAGVAAPAAGFAAGDVVAPSLTRPVHAGTTGLGAELARLPAPPPPPVVVVVERAGSPLDRPLEAHWFRDMASDSGEWSMPTAGYAPPPSPTTADAGPADPTGSAVATVGTAGTSRPADPTATTSAGADTPAWAAATAAASPTPAGPTAADPRVEPPAPTERRHSGATADRPGIAAAGTDDPLSGAATSTDDPGSTTPNPAATAARSGQRESDRAKPAPPAPDREPLDGQVPDREPLGGQVPDREPLGGQVPDREPLGGQVADRDPLAGDATDRDPLGGKMDDRDPLGGEVADSDPLGRDAADRDLLDGKVDDGDPLGGEVADRDPLGRNTTGQGGGGGASDRDGTSSRVQSSPDRRPDPESAAAATAGRDAAGQPSVPRPRQSPEQGWRTAADEGWHRAMAAAEPETAGTTRSGLPKRVPQAQLVPGGVQPGGRTRSRRSPDEVRGLLSAYHRGVQRGRTAASAETEDAAPGAKENEQ